MLTARAPAKVNLTLRVLGRRADGYHALESLVAFAGTGDSLTLHPGEDGPMTLAGPFGAALSAGQDNLVLKAERGLRAALPGLRSGRFHLVKRLPVASGIGGGSADAAAALRLLARLNGLRLDDPVLLAVAAAIGADVPVCLQPRARMMRGIGERLGAPLRLPRLFSVLANPGVPVETAAVFSALGLARGAMRADTEKGDPTVDSGDPTAFHAALAGDRNDLEAPACTVAPVIAEAVAALSNLPGCRLARMSGSGATCFGLFDDCGQAADAARALARARPGWWVKATLLS